jgi:hypothetical protein
MLGAVQDNQMPKAMTKFRGHLRQSLASHRQGTARPLKSFRQWGEFIGRAAMPQSEGSATPSTDHDEIRNWVERHGGHPAIVAETRGKDGGGILRIDFDDPGENDERLERIGWNEFFRVFDRNRLAFLHDDGSSSRFNKFVERESAES